MCQCRICLDDMLESEKVQYCSCIGSNGYVHFECLEKWIRGNNYKNECEICKSKYRLKFTPKYNSVFSFDFICLLFTAIASLIACILVWSFYGVSENIEEKNNFETNIKNTILYLPFIFCHGIRFKYVSSRKVLSYKLVFIGVDEQTRLLEKGEELSINSSIGSEAQPLIVD